MARGELIAGNFVAIMHLDLGTDTGNTPEVGEGQRRGLKSNYDAFVSI